MKNLSVLLLAVWLIVSGVLVLLGTGFPFGDLVVPVLAIAAGVLILLDLRFSRIRSNLGLFLLSIWLILTGALSFLSTGIPFQDMAMAILAIAAGVLLLLTLRGNQWRDDLGRLFLCVWLILTGVLPLINISFAAAGTLLAILAVVTGVLLLLRR